MPPLKVSVVVPVYNPGSDIEDTIRTLVHEQSLPRDSYEVIFVDDGSTDETPARLAAVAAENDHVRVHRIPNSGWPGKPRNVGTDMARGEYVYYVDDDDWIEPEALERMYDMAISDDADVVVGKVVSTLKAIPRVLFKKNRHATSLDQAWSLLSLMSPHKMFRRALLQQHDIRFPEGPRRLEDNFFVMHAYMHAERVSVLSDYVCYHWTVRDENLSRGGFDPTGYFGNVREVLDLVDRHTEPGPFREKVYAHYYRGKMMKRVGPFLARGKPAYRREVYKAVRDLALERYGDWIHDYLRFNLRVRSRLLRGATFDELKVFAKYERAMKVQARVTELTPDDGVLVLRFDATVSAPDGALAFTREDGTVRWRPPESLAGLLTDEQRDVREDLEESTVEVLLRRPDTGVRFMAPATVHVHLEPVAGDEAGVLTPVVSIEARIDPATAAAGAALAAGEWNVIGNLTVGGFMQPMQVKHPDGGLLQLIVTEDGRVRARPRPDDPHDPERPKQPKQPKKAQNKAQASQKKTPQRRKPPPPPPSGWRRVARAARRLAGRVSSSGP